MGHQMNVCFEGLINKISTVPVHAQMVFKFSGCLKKDIYTRYRRYKSLLASLITVANSNDFTVSGIRISVLDFFAVIGQYSSVTAHVIAGIGTIFRITGGFRKTLRVTSGYLKAGTSLTLEGFSELVSDFNEISRKKFKFLILSTKRQPNFVKTIIAHTKCWYRLDFLGPLKKGHYPFIGILKGVGTDIVNV
jgi:hypothetical protein